MRIPPAGRMMYRVGNRRIHADDAKLPEFHQLGGIRIFMQQDRFYLANIRFRRNQVSGQIVIDITRRPHPDLSRQRTHSHLCKLRAISPCRRAGGARKHQLSVSNLR